MDIQVAASVHPWCDGYPATSLHGATRILPHHYRCHGYPATSLQVLRVSCHITTCCHRYPATSLQVSWVSCHIITRCRRYPATSLQGVTGILPHHYRVSRVSCHITTGCHNPEVRFLNPRRRENFTTRITNKGPQVSNSYGHN